MEMSESINELTKALVASQGQFQTVSKDKDGYNYRYATLQNIVENTRPYLVENGITVMQFPTSTPHSIGVTTLMSHTSGQWVKSAFTMPVESGTKMSGAQESGKVVTYARRYAYAAVLGIVVDEDTDAAPPKKRPVPARKKPVPAKKPAQPKKPVPYELNQEVMVKGKNDEKLGTFLRMEGDKLFVKVGDKEFPIGADRVQAVGPYLKEEQSALIKTPAKNGAHQ